PAPAYPWHRRRLAAAAWRGKARLPQTALACGGGAWHPRPWHVLLDRFDLHATTAGALADPRRARLPLSPLRPLRRQLRPVGPMGVALRRGRAPDGRTQRLDQPVVARLAAGPDH